MGPRAPPTSRPHATRVPAAGRTGGSAHVAAAAALLALALALAPGGGAAQVFDGTQRVDAFTGPVVSSGRILGLGGAYVAVGEGLGGAAVNPAAVAQRQRGLARGWDWDWFVTWYVPEARDVGRQDLGNDGGRDVGLSGVANGQLGLAYQRGVLGVGLLWQSWKLSAPRDGLGVLEMEIGEASFPVASSFWRDELIVGAALAAVSGVVRLSRPGAAPVALEYAGTTVRLGALHRPRGQPWRLGLALDPGARATVRGDRSALPVSTPAGFEFPWVLSLGAAGWVGPNARRCNEPPPYELDRHREWGPGPEWEEARRGPVLLSAQLDLVGPASGAVAVESVLVASARAPPSGGRVSVVPRAGAEWEPFPERGRVRGGAYLEPSRTGTSPRLHGTFGVEVRVPFPIRDLQLGLSGDLAARFENVSVSLGFWSSVGPPRPAARGPGVPLGEGEGDAGTE